MLAAATAVFRLTNLDLWTVGLFFSGDAANKVFAARWPFVVAQPWKALYDWGVYPAWIIGCGGLIVWLVSFVWTKLERCRDRAFFSFCCSSWARES